jgi:hypothetical protein
MPAALVAAAALAVIQTPPDLSWMSGYWLDCSDGREASETWSDARGDLLLGHAVTVGRGRTTFEHMRVQLDGDTPVYVAQPQGGSAVTFTLLEGGEGRAVFQNTANDYPHRVIYARDGEALTARIEGGGPTLSWRFQPAALNARCPA